MKDDEPLFELTAEDLKLLGGGPKRRKKGNVQLEPTGPTSEELGYDPVTLKNNPKFKHDLKMDYEIQRWNGTSWEYFPTEEYRFVCVSPEDVLKHVHKDDRRGTYRIRRFYARRKEKE